MKTRTTNLWQQALAISMCLVMFAGPILAQGNKAPVKTDTRILYHNGPVMQGASNVYIIWYGNWFTGNDPYAISIIQDLVLNLGGSAYFQINAGYPDQNGISPNGGLIFTASLFEPTYSKGADLTVLDIQSIVSDQITTRLPGPDPAGLYLVLASPDIHARVAGFCQPNAAPHHAAFMLNSVQVKYAFIGNPRRCPSIAPQLTFPWPTPNDDFGADAMANMIAAVFSNMVTNPAGTGWFDRYGFENSTKCQGIFGPTYQAANGSLANIRIGQRDFLLQQNWVNARKGYCAIATPTPQ